MKTELAYFVCCYLPTLSTYSEVVSLDMVDLRKILKGNRDLVTCVVQEAKVNHNNFSTLL